MIDRNNLLFSAIAVLTLSLTACGGGSGGNGGSSNPDPDPDPVVTPDTTPNAFSFAAQSDAEQSVWVESSSVTVSGINEATNISVTGGEYAIGSNGFTAAAGQVSNGQTVRVRVQTADAAEQSSIATLTIGGVSATFTVVTAAEVVSGNIVVDINFDRVHSVNGVDQFDRQKYITIHASHLENGWGENDSHSRNAPNAEDNLLAAFTNGYDVYFGRDTGSVGWQLRNAAEDSSRSGFVDESITTLVGGDTKWTYSNGTSDKLVRAREVEFRAQDMIAGGQQHPYWPEGTMISAVNNNRVPANSDWAFSQTDTVAEPLGTATGHYFGQFLSKYFKVVSTDTGTTQPAYFEVMNEPLYDLTTVRSGADRVEPVDVFRFHNSVATEIRKIPANDSIAIGGYTAAFPNFEEDDFQRWQERDKLFIDTSGANMDFFSIHLYDFPAFQNSERYRKGSNIEATLDMLDHYSALTLGEVKPTIISEYGAQIHSLINEGWSPLRNTHSLRSTNAQLMSFLERPDSILKTIPFIVVKAEWGRKEVNGETVPYGPRLMIQEFERTGNSADTSWVYSDLIQFYDLWSEVSGTRIDTYATDLDIQVDAYVDGNTAYVILNSLEFDEVDIDLNALGLDEDDITNVTIRHMVSDDTTQQASSIQTTTSATLPETVSLDGEGTMIIKIESSTAFAPSQTLAETKHYATSYLQAIAAGQAIQQSINNVSLAANGEAVLRLSVGRDHGKSLLPVVTVNGQAVTVPADFRGYDQVQGRTNSGRLSFYGTLEIPVPYALLQQNNAIEVTFPDAGGHVASTVLQVFNSTDAVVRP